MDMLVLIEFLLDLQELQEDLKKYAGFLLIVNLITINNNLFFL